MPRIGHFIINIISHKMQLLTKTAAPDHLRVNFEHFLMEMAIPRDVFLISVLDSLVALAQCCTAKL